MRRSSAIQARRYQSEVVCRYGDSRSALSVLDNHVQIDGTPAKYHSIHEWIIRDGRLAVLLVYLHEYDLFEVAWQ